MSLAVLVFAASASNQAVKVSPAPILQIERSSKHHGTLSILMCGTKQLTSRQFDLTVSHPTQVSGGGYQTNLSLLTDGDAKSADFKLQMSGKGWPMSCKAVGEGDEGQGITYLLMYMRVPLRPAKGSASSWKVSLPNPLEDKQASMKVLCTARKAPGKAGSVLIEQKSEPLALQARAKVQLVSKVTLDSKSGTVSSVHETLEVLSGATKMQVIEYDER